MSLASAYYIKSKSRVDDFSFASFFRERYQNGSVDEKDRVRCVSDESSRWCRCRSRNTHVGLLQFENKQTKLLASFSSLMKTWMQETASIVGSTLYDYAEGHIKASIHSNSSRN